MKNHNLFQKIYDENYLRMYHVAFGILKNQADAENAVSEAFLSIAENHKKYFKISGSKMPGLCVTIVKHKSIDILRRQKHWSAEKCTVIAERLGISNLLEKFLDELSGGEAQRVGIARAIV